MGTKLDQKDIQILDLLQNDAKITQKELAHEVGISITPVFERVKKLENEGIIKNYTAIVDTQKLGYNTFVYCGIKLKEHIDKKIENFQNQVIKLPEVLECNHLTGEFDYLLKVQVKSIEDYQKFLTGKLASIDNIFNVQSYFVLKQLKQEHHIPLSIVTI